MKDLLLQLNFKLKEGSSGVFIKKYTDGYIIEVDFEKENIDYGDKIKSESKTTSNFSQSENFVVLECVDRLLEKGYNPENVILEKTWKAGHQHSGRLDVCVTRDDGSEYLLIECKTYGKEFDKELARLNKDGGQLFTYFKFSNKADIIMLYASELHGKEVVYRNEVIKIEDEYRTGDVKDFYEKWNKLTKDNGIFEDWVLPYNFESKALTLKDLKEIRQEDSSFIFNRFLEILRHNVVSDKPNAFNKIFTLFLCKVYDEKSSKKTEELGFQWKEGQDDNISFQIRLTELYKNGMREFLEKEVTDFSNEEFEKEYNYLDVDVRAKLLERINKIRLEKNNEFAIKEVYDEDSFKENAKIVKEVVELLQGYKIRYNKRQQYLSDFFELLLTTGLKQESGQFFTPVPVAQFIIKSLPIDSMVKSKLEKGERNDLLPFIIDYAAGSGHFLTESMHEIQEIIDEQNPSSFIPDTEKKLKNWQEDHFDWATQYVYGIEKDYRLVKVGKVGCYLHGDGLANVILGDGLANFKNKDYKGLLKKNDPDFPQENKQFDIIVSNPPYSVSAFKMPARDFYTEKDFELYNNLTEDSSEIEALFIERTKQLLKDGGVAGIILPSTILTNAGIYTKAREIILQYFEILSIAELGGNTFMATNTNTIVLFLRRRNNYESINIKKAVEKFFTNHKDVTLNGIERPVNKYVTHVWEGLTFDDYLTLLKKDPNEQVQSHEIYKEYVKKFRGKEFLEQILERELEKLFYFILAYPQKVVLIKSGQKAEEKRFLGYKFSNRRGSEGIHPIQRGKSISECTQLFDEHTFENPEKASTYIYQAFRGDFDSPVPDALKKHINRLDLVNMLTFDRVDFEKSISTMVKKKLKNESKWNIVNISKVAKIKNGFAFKSDEYVEDGLKIIRMKNIKNGFIQDDESVFVSKERENEFKDFLLYDNDILVSMTGDPGRVAKIKKENLPALLNQRVGKFEFISEDILKDYFYAFTNTKYFENSVVSLSHGAAQLNVSSSQIESIKIPIPPLGVQQKIVSEIETLEQKEEEVKRGIEEAKTKIETLFNNALAKADSNLRLSDNTVFDIFIGRRLLKSEILPKGDYPVFSANVFEPFGYIDELLIEDFSTPSVLWGIDGDWLVNYYPENKPFYPTDHCGVLRVKNNAVNERYLAFVLEKEGRSFEFSRTKRASIDRIKNIKIPVPSLSEQKKVVLEIKKIEGKISTLEKELAEIPKQKETVLKEYL